MLVLTPGPGRVRAELKVSLPVPRDQITTKELPEFVRLRTEVSRLVRGRTAPPESRLNPPESRADPPESRAGRARRLPRAPVTPRSAETSREDAGRHDDGHIVGENRPNVSRVEAIIFPCPGGHSRPGSRTVTRPGLRYYDIDATLVSLSRHQSDIDAVGVGGPDWDGGTREHRAHHWHQLSRTSRLPGASCGCERC